MSSIYKDLALEALQKNSQHAIKQFQAIIDDCSKLQVVIDEALYYPELMFVTAELISKSILRGDFLAVEESISQDEESERVTQLERIKIYSSIMSKVYRFLKVNNVRDYLLRSCSNLVTLCLKCIFERSIQIKLATVVLQDYIQILLPQFIINQQFINNYHGETDVLTVNPTNIPQGFSLAMKILTSLLDYVTTNAYFKSYYDFRRNIYTFRNSHLAIILNIAINYAKILFKICQDSHWNLNEWILSNLAENLSLVDAVFMYPFTLNTQQHENQMEPNDNISGVGIQIYFPNYFRNVLVDRCLIGCISHYYSVLMATADHKHLPELKKLVRIIGRMINCSGYSFNTDNERISFRGEAVSICIMLTNQCRHDDAYLLNSISQIIIKIINSFSSLDFNNKKPLFLEAMLRYSNLMIETRIILSEGKKNPINYMFEIITLCVYESIECTNMAVIHHAAQNILEKLYLRMLDGQQTSQMLKQLGENNPNQIEVFQQIFSNVLTVFQNALQKNLSYLLSIDLSQLNEWSKIFYLHFASILLPSQQAKPQQTILILKYFQLAKQTSCLASLHYIDTLVNQVIIEIQDGVSTTPLWKNMYELTHESFNNFILFVLQTCFNNFAIPNLAIIDYSLQIFKSIYLKLKKNDKPQFEVFYELVRNLIANINATVFINPKFFKKRSSLFNVISIIWINANEYKHSYQIYNLIQRQILQDRSLLGLMKYLIDITGLLEPIQIHQPFKIIAQLCINDLSIILPQIISPTTISSIFSETQFIKIFLHLVLQLCNDNHSRLTIKNHSRLPLQIHDLFYKYLVQMINFQYPKIIVTVWSKFIFLNPLSDLLPIRIEMKTLQSPDYYTMLGQYFSCINRSADLQGMYKYVEGNVEWMADWWEEVISRQLLPNINVKEVVEARIWKTRRQKQILAKMLYSIGRYNNNYWKVPNNCNERFFINYFMQNYI